MGWDSWLRDPDYADLNGAMVEVMAEHAGSLLENNDASEKRVDLALAKALMAKHGVEAREDDKGQMRLFG